MAGNVKRRWAPTLRLRSMLSTLGSALREADAVLDAILEWRERPFVYGDSDCCQFVCYVYGRVNDDNYMPHVYQGEAEAALLLAQYGGLANAVNQVLDCCHVAPEWLRAGDLALCRRGDDETLGIVLPSEVVVTVRQPDGKLTFLPRDSIECGWRID